MVTRNKRGLFQQTVYLFSLYSPSYLATCCFLTSTKLRIGSSFPTNLWPNKTIIVAIQPVHKILVYLSHMRPTKAQTSQRLRSVSTTPLLLVLTEWGHRWRLKFYYIHTLFVCLLVCLLACWCFMSQSTTSWVGPVLRVACTRRRVLN